MQTKFPKQFKDEIVFGFTSGHQGFTYSDIDRTLPVDPGSKIRGEHYGFTIKTSDGESTEYSWKTSYKTQCPIEAVTSINGKICIYEKGKINPWELSVTGRVFKAATFNSFADAEYLKGFGVTDAEQIKQLNQEAMQEIDEAKRERIKRPEGSIRSYTIR